MTRLLILFAAAVFSLAACATDPYTGERKTSNTAKGGAGGAAAGAALGAIIGAATGKGAAKGAAIGAGVGALTGVGVGAYMDAQERQLRRRLQATGVQVRREGDEIVLVMPGGITFDTDSAAVRGDFFEVLDSVALVLDEYERTVVQIDGHTDNTGAADYNRDLSRRRAETVARYLINRGVGPNERFVIRGFGESSPVATNTTAQGRQLNRRVEITLSPITA